MLRISRALRGRGRFGARQGRDQGGIRRSLERRRQLFRLRHLI